MENTSFYTDSRTEERYIQYLSNLQERGLIQNLSVEGVDGDINSPIVYVSFDYPEKFKLELTAAQYVPMQLTYTSSLIEKADDNTKMTELMIKVMSELSQQDVQNITIDGDNFTFFIGNGIPLYMRPDNVRRFTEILTSLQDCTYLTSDPVVILTGIAVKKVTDCDIWCVRYDTDKDEVYKAMNEIHEKGIHNIRRTVYFDEVVYAFDLNTFEKDGYTFISHTPRKEGMLEIDTTAVAGMVSDYGAIPTLTYSFVVPQEVTVAQFYATFVAIYVTVMNQSPYNYTNSPAQTDSIIVEKVGSSMKVSFPCPSIHALDSIYDMMKVTPFMNTLPVSHKKIALVLRATLSKMGIRSIYIPHMNVVGYFGKKMETITLLSMEETYEMILKHISTLTHHTIEPITHEQLTEMEPEDLVELVIGSSKHPISYSMSMMRLETPTNRKMFSMDDMFKAGHNLKGYHTWGPLLGIVDSPVYDPPIVYSDLYVDVSAEHPYVSSESISAAIESGTTPIEDTDIVTFTLDLYYDDDTFDDICTLTLPKKEVEEARALLEKGLKQGMFMRPWSRAFKAISMLTSHTSIDMGNMFVGCVDSVERSRAALIRLSQIIV